MSYWRDQDDPPGTGHRELLNFTSTFYVLDQHGTSLLLFDPFLNEKHIHSAIPLPEWTESDGSRSVFQAQLIDASAGTVALLGTAWLCAQDGSRKALRSLLTIEVDFVILGGTRGTRSTDPRIFSTNASPGHSWHAFPTDGAPASV